MTGPLVPAEAIAAAAEAMAPRSAYPVSSRRLTGLATAALEAGAPYIRARAELAAGKAVMRREERIQELERIADEMLAAIRPLCAVHGDDRLARWTAVRNASRVADGGAMAGDVP